MSEPFTIRLAGTADVPTIARQRAAMFRDMGELDEALFGPLVEASSRYLSTAIASGEYVGWLALPVGESEEVVAGAGLQLRRVLPRPHGSGRGLALGVQGLVLNVYTEPRWRRRGVAALLMTHVVDWARANGLVSLVLHASAEGRALYERLGFVPTNEMRYAADLADPA